MAIWPIVTGNKTHPCLHLWVKLLGVGGSIPKVLILPLLSLEVQQRSSVAAMKKIWVPRSIIISRCMAWKHLIDGQPPAVRGWTCGRGKVTEEHFVCTQLIWGHVTRSAEQPVTACYEASCPPFCTAAQQSKLSRPRSYSRSPLGNAHLCILYTDITPEPMTPCCYVTCSSCTVQSKAVGCSDQRSPADKCSLWRNSSGGFKSLLNLFRFFSKNCKYAASY